MDAWPNELIFAVDGQITRLPACGRHLLSPALAAWCVGRSFGIREAEISKRLASFTLPKRRCEVLQRGGATLIDDTHCSSLASLRAGLELLQTVDTSGRRFAVCGELTGGAGATSSHYQRWGEEAVTIGGADAVLAIGQHRCDIIAGARSAGMRARDCLEFSSDHELHTALAGLMAPGDAVLFKGVGGGCVDACAAELAPRRTERAAAA
jgi:UDP-N-acetylmuramyl pentapeptide synthase